MSLSRSDGASVCLIMPSFFSGKPSNLELLLAALTSLLLFTLLSPRTRGIITAADRLAIPTTMSTRDAMTIIFTDRGDDLNQTQHPPFARP